MPLPGGDAVGRPAVGQISSSTTTITGLFSTWAAPTPKGVAVAVLLSTGSGFCPTPPAQAAPVFSNFAEPQQKPSIIAEQPRGLFETAPATPTPIEFSTFAAVKAPSAKRASWQSFVFQPTAIPFSGFCNFDAPHQYGGATKQTGYVNFEVRSLPIAVPPGGTSRKLHQGGLEKVKKLPLPPPAPPKPQPVPVWPVEKPLTIEAELPPAQIIDEALIPPNLLTLQDQVMGAQDTADVENFLRSLDQDEQDAADIAEVIAMLDQDDLD